MDRYRVPESRWLCFPLRLQLIISPILRSPQQTLVNTSDFPDIPPVTPVTLSPFPPPNLAPSFSSRFLRAPSRQVLHPVAHPRPLQPPTSPLLITANYRAPSAGRRSMHLPPSSILASFPAPLSPFGLRSCAAAVSSSHTQIVNVVHKSLCRRSTIRIVQRTTHSLHTALST
ncbi:hypothetical protein C8Q73DRAFT_97476 [Cubamyces lactineus]|nr:hypothetical protein C8Q73DRAFT_97476 [Cubamyces lactineus]